MKQLIFSFAILFAFLGKVNAQAGMDDVTDTELQKFWKSNIGAIVSLDKPKVIAQTYFPLGGEWNFVLDVYDVSEEELEAAYKERLEEIFDEDLRSRLKEMTWESVAILDFEEGILLSVIVLSEEVYEEEVIEFGVELSFDKIDGKWMLVSINYMG